MGGEAALYSLLLPTTMIWQGILLDILLLILCVGWVLSLFVHLLMFIIFGPKNAIGTSHNYFLFPLPPTPTHRQTLVRDWIRTPRIRDWWRPKLHHCKAIIDHGGGHDDDQIIIIIIITIISILDTNLSPSPTADETVSFRYQNYHQERQQFSLDDGLLHRHDENDGPPTPQQQQQQQQ